MSDLLPDPVYFASLPTVITSAAVILRDETGRFLIVEPTYRDHWLLPGGGVDAGEDPRQCARREVAEELGLDIEVGRLLGVDWLGSRASVGAPMGAHFLFDGGVISADALAERVRLQASELSAWRLIGREQAPLLSGWGAARALRGLDVLEGRALPDLA